MATITRIPPHHRVGLPDPKDEYLVALARQPYVDVLVSGDRHLLEANVLGVKVLRTAEVLGLLSNRSEERST